MASKLDAFKLLPQRLGLIRTGVGWRFLLSATIMAAYMVGSRIIYHAQGYSFADVELIRTPFRLAGAILFWFLMADVIFARRPDARPLRKASAVIGLGLLLITPILTYGHETPTADVLVLAATSFPVALFEELFFRGILQSLLMKYVGAFQGTCLTALAFAFYHIGATSPDALNLIHIFLAGMILSLIYCRTRSIVATTVIHTVDNVLISLPFEALLPSEFAIVLLMVSLLLIAFWTRAATDEGLNPLFRRE